MAVPLPLLPGQAKTLESHRRPERIDNAIRLYIELPEIGPREIFDAVGDLYANFACLRVNFTQGGNGWTHELKSSPPDLRDVIELLEIDGEIDEITTYLRKRDVLEFEVSKGPWVRFILVRRPGGNCLIFVSMHHSIADGITAARIARRLRKALGGDAVNEDEVDYEFAVRHTMVRIERAHDPAYWTAVSDRLASLAVQSAASHVVGRNLPYIGRLRIERADWDRHLIRLHRNRLTPAAWMLHKYHEMLAQHSLGGAIGTQIQLRDSKTRGANGMFAVGRPIVFGADPSDHVAAREVQAMLMRAQGRVFQDERDKEPFRTPMIESFLQRIGGFNYLARGGFMGSYAPASHAALKTKWEQPRAKDSSCSRLNVIDDGGAVQIEAKFHRDVFASDAPQEFLQDLAKRILGSASVSNQPLEFRA